MKYGNKKVEYNGLKFDSKREAYYYQIYKKLEQQGDLWNLKLQTKLDFKIDGKHIFYYKPDFEYDDRNGHHYIDVKSPATEKNAVFRLKRKLIENYYKVKIEIVM